MPPTRCASGLDPDFRNFLHDDPRKQLPHNVQKLELSLEAIDQMGQRMRASDFQRQLPRMLSRQSRFQSLSWWGREGRTLLAVGKPGLGDVPPLQSTRPLRDLDAYLQGGGVVQKGGYRPLCVQRALGRNRKFVDHRTFEVRSASQRSCSDLNPSI